MEREWAKGNQAGYVVVGTPNHAKRVKERDLGLEAGKAAGAEEAKNRIVCVPDEKSVNSPILVKSGLGSKTQRISEHLRGD